MIRVICHTSIDEYKMEEWPSAFATAPMRGDCVRAKSGKQLEIVGITHSMEYAGGSGVVERSPVVIVELHRSLVYREINL